MDICRRLGYDIVVVGTPATIRDPDGMAREELPRQVQVELAVVFRAAPVWSVSSPARRQRRNQRHATAWRAGIRNFSASSALLEPFAARPGPGAAKLFEHGTYLG